MSQASAKRCVVCGEDCAGRPRIKDPKGRYFCQECYDKARQRAKLKHKARPRATPKQHESDGEPTLGHLVADQIPSVASDSGTACPGCGQAIAQGGVLCTSCGYNLQTGEMLTVQTVEPASDWSAGSGLATNPIVAAMALLAVYIVLFVLGRTLEPAAVALLLGSSLIGFGIWVAVLICAFRVSIGQGLLTWLVPLYILWFVYGINDNRHLKWLFAISIAGWALSCALIVLLAVDGVEPGLLQISG